METQRKPAQLIAEIVCKRFFFTQGFKELPPKFWNDIRFARNYRLQIIKANSLLKIYKPQAIINALKSKQGSTIYSLTAKWLDPLIAVEQAKIEKLEKQLENAINSPQNPPPNSSLLIENDVPRPAFKTGTSLLEELE